MPGWWSFENQGPQYCKKVFLSRPWQVEFVGDVRQSHTRCRRVPPTCQGGLFLWRPRLGKLARACLPDARWESLWEPQARMLKRLVSSCQVANETETQSDKVAKECFREPGWHVFGKPRSKLLPKYVLASQPGWESLGTPESRTLPVDAFKT